MNDFERVYQIESPREITHQIEKNLSIELSDMEFIYKPLVVEEMSPDLKEKFEKAKKITQETQVIDLRETQPPKIPINLEMAELEKSIKEGKKNERKKIKAPSKRTNKANSKSN